MHSIAWWPTLIAVLIAAVSDILSRRIPNWLVVPFLVSGLVVSPAIRGWIGLEQSLFGVLLGGLVFGVLHRLGGMGMGDVKLCAAIGAWIGPEQLGIALVVTGIAGGVMAIVWAASGGFLKESLSGAADLVFGIRKRGLKSHATLLLANPAARAMPYAPAIAIGTVFSFFTLS